MKKRMYVPQIFAPEANTIVTTDLDPAISIDHSNRLVAGIQSIQRVLGLTQLTPMGAGTQVKQWKYTKKNTPAQVTEGELIPLTQYERKLANTFTLTLKKYRKQTTAEAIQRVGRTIAINDTDELLQKEVQKDVKSTFFTLLGTGSGTVVSGANVTTLQAVLASLWGAMSVKFADMNVTPVYFVNPLTIAEYLATANITIQTAFGFQYVENFLGLGTVIIDPAVDAGDVLSTVKENLNGIYIPAGGDVAQTFGLTYDQTGMVGMKHFTKDDYATVDTLIMSGVTFYAEDLTGVFKATVTP